jgi:hypothetical protein
MSETLTGTYEDWDYEIQIEAVDDSFPRVIGLSLVPSTESNADNFLTARFFRGFPLASIVRSRLASNSTEVHSLLKLLLDLTGGRGKDSKLLIAALAYTVAIQRGSRKPTSDTAHLLGLTVGAVHARLQRARDRGLLHEANQPGLCGGIITDKGMSEIQLLVGGGE